MKRFLGIGLLCSLVLGTVGLPADAYAQKNKKKTESTKKAAKETPKAVEKTENEPAAAGGTGAAAEQKTAEETTPLYKYEAPAEPESSYGWLIVKTLFVIGLMAFGFYAFFKFILKKTGVPLATGGAIKVLSVTPLGPNRSLHIVDVAGRVMLLGTTDSNVNLLTEITAKEEIDRIRLESSRGPTGGEKNFQDFLADGIGSVAGFIRTIADKRAGGGKRERTTFKDEVQYHSSDEPVSDRMEYIMRQKERLRRLGGEDDE